MTVRDFQRAASDLPHSEVMPALFIGHGSPMNLIEDSKWARDWRALGATLPKPAAILCISAHWYTEGTYVHEGNKPRTIHDFYGFPPELYAMQYACDGAPSFAYDVRRSVKGVNVEYDTAWGIDHGAWMPLAHLFPKADVPVFQLSVDGTKDGQFHYDLARELAPLRRKGVLIIGSGNIVHNLGMIDADRDAEPFEWAATFDAKAAELIRTGNHHPLINYRSMGRVARMAVPTPDHYFPLLSALALQEKDEKPDFFTDGMAHGSVSMRSFILGR